MADLIAFSQGDRSTSLVSNRGEIVAQVNTWKGLVRVWMDKDGDFEVYVADEKGENGLLLLKGNANQRTASDAFGDPIKADPLAGRLDPIVVKNRTKAYTAKQSGASSAAGTSSQAASAPSAQSAAAPSPATAATSNSTTSSASPKKTTRKKKAATTGTQVKTEKFDASKVQAGTRVIFKLSGDGSSKAVQDEEGTVKKVGTSPLGPIVEVNWDKAGFGTVFPEQGDVIEVVA